MIGRIGLALLGLVLVLPLLAPAAASHYVPKVGDSFDFYETIQLANGTGANYTGYTENYFINGTRTITEVPSNLTVSATYADDVNWENNTGSAASWTSAGNFSFSASTFRYVAGTDNQTGYTNPYVWFFMNNLTAVGGTFYLLNTQMTLESTSATYTLPGSSTGYVKTLFAEGSGSYQRDDAYGIFDAVYSWKAYFDPSTGYIVGYLYSETDSNATGNGFTWVDSLHVTHTTFPLTAASAPPSPSSGGSGVPLLYIILAVVVVLIIILIVVAAALRRRRRRSAPLPRHSPTGSVAYGPPPPPPPMGVPPPVHLTPAGQPAVQQVVIKETVKVNCRYCGSLIDSTATVCPFCGAPRT